MPTRFPNMSHWGAYDVEVDEGRITRVLPFAGDREPSPLVQNVPALVDASRRVRQPYVRRGWLHPETPADDDEYLPVSWDRAVDLAANALRTVIDDHGPQAIFGGSYGWASAGRFHHAQSQVHRFLTCIGGYTRSVNTYSNGCSMVLLPHLVGADQLFRKLTSWSVIAEHTEVLLAFGGIPDKNLDVIPGGVSDHVVGSSVRSLADRGVEVVNVGPQRSDVTDAVGAEWMPARPGTDTAIMLAMAYVLVDEGLHDRVFLDRYTVGADEVEAYVRGERDGIPKTPEWAEGLSGVPAADIRRIARRLVERRSLITVTYSLQRAPQGEQPVWAALTLAAMVGQIGLPGGGYSHGLGSMGDQGVPDVTLPLPTFPQGANPVADYIPCADITEMLEHPGEEYDYDGHRLTYPEIHVVYWAGGNPFHHHQNLPRLTAALRSVDVVIAHEQFWTPMARHADIVFPATTNLERDDIGASRADSRIVAMKAAVPPVGDALDDFEIFARLATAMGVGEQFTGGRSSTEWIRALYDDWRARLADRHGVDVPSFDEFWQTGEAMLPPSAPRVWLEDFRADPDGRPLRTPSGRIELFSDRIAGFDYADSPGQAMWLTPDESHLDARASDFPLVLISNQPRTRLHSQLAHGAHSAGEMTGGREVLRMSGADAAARGLSSGSVVRAFNDRGACLAALQIDDRMMPGVVELPTGAWYDPVEVDGTVLCRAGNPNVLTSDAGTSTLTAGSSGARVLVEVEAFADSPAFAPFPGGSVPRPIAPVGAPRAGA